MRSEAVVSDPKALQGTSVGNFHNIRKENHSKKQTPIQFTADLSINTFPL
jgi:hypothetical protein